MNFLHLLQWLLNYCYYNGRILERLDNGLSGSFPDQSFILGLPNSMAHLLVALRGWTFVIYRSLTKWNDYLISLLLVLRANKSGVKLSIRRQQSNGKISPFFSRPVKSSRLFNNRHLEKAHQKHIQSPQPNWPFYSLSLSFSPTPSTCATLSTSLSTFYHLHRSPRFSPNTRFQLCT